MLIRVPGSKEGCLNKKRHSPPPWGGGVAEIAHIAAHLKHSTTVTAPRIIRPRSIDQSHCSFVASAGYPHGACLRECGRCIAGHASRGIRVAADYDVVELATKVYRRFAWPKKTFKRSRSGGQSSTSTQLL